MPIPSNIDPTSLTMLRIIARQPGVTTRELEAIVFLSKSQTLRRLKQLEEQGLIGKSNGETGKTYHYTLASNVTVQEVEQLNISRLTQNQDLVAREALRVILGAIQVFSQQLNDLATRIRNILE